VSGYLGVPKRIPADHESSKAAGRHDELGRLRACRRGLDYMPGKDSCPFEPKASDWEWFEGRTVALDYSTPAWEADKPTSA